MKIFYDESGDFSLDKVPNISVVGSLICTEGFYEDLCYFMNSFEKKIADYNTRLSDQEYLQSILTTQNIRKTLQHTLVYYIDYKYAKYFKDYFFIFDRKLSTKLSPMEKYIDTYLLPFLQGNPEKQQALAIVGIWKKGHPFVDNYLNKDGDIMLNAIFKNGLRFVDSKEEPGIRLIDIVCNTLYSYLHFPENREYLNCYTLIKTAIGHQGDKYIDLVMLNPKNSIPNDYPVYGKVL